MTKEEIKNSLLGTAGAATTAYGGYQVFRPLRVGVTYGSDPGWGSGHAQPGKAFRSLLAERLNRPLESVDVINRLNAEGDVQFVSKAGTVKIKPPDVKKLPAYDVMLTTGMSPYRLMDWAAKGSETNLGPKVRSGGFITYLTDVAKPGGAISEYVNPKTKNLARWERRAVSSLIPDSFISYGQTLPQLPEGMTEFNVSKHIAPAITDDITKAIGGKDFQQVSLKLVREHIQKQLSNPQISALDKRLYTQSLQALEGAGNKRIFTVIGSGRGDAVAQRIVDLKRAMTPAQRANTLFIAGLGDSFTTNPLSNIVRRLPNVVAVGKVDQPTYFALQNAAHKTFASTGTNSLFESLLSPSETVISDLKPFAQRELAYLQRKLKNPKSLVSQWYHQVPNNPFLSQLQSMAEGSHSPDVWNLGNKLHAAQYPGVTYALTPQEILKAFDKSSADVGLNKSEFFAKELAVSHANTKKALDYIINRQKLLKNAKGVGLGLAGLTALYIAVDRMKKKQKQQVILQRA